MDAVIRLEKDYLPTFLSRTITIRNDIFEQTFKNIDNVLLHPTPSNTKSVKPSRRADSRHDKSD